MRKSLLRITSALLSIAYFMMTIWSTPPAAAQSAPEVYTAMLIASEAVAGSGAGRINIRIISQSSEVERKNLKEAFQKSDAEGLALLQSMSKGFINIEGQPGRKVFAVFSRPRKGGYELVIISEHVASKLEQWRAEKAEEHPLAVIHIKLDDGGDPVSGEVFPAVKVAVTQDGFVDIQTKESNKVMMTNLAKK